MATQARQIKKDYWRRRGWKDLIFVAVVGLLWYPLRHDFFPRTDKGKWEARPRLLIRANVSTAPTFGSDGVDPCFFRVPNKASGQPVASGTFGECLELVPDGRKLDLFEVPIGEALIHVKTDLWIDGAMPVAFTRVTGQLTDWDKRTHNEIRNVYNLYLYGNRFPFTYVFWVLPDDQEVQYERVSRGTGYANAVYEHSDPRPVFGGSQIAWNGSGYDLDLQSGMTYLSPEAYHAKRPQQGSVVAIFDSEGREVRLLRKSNGDLTEIRSPEGHSMSFSYDDSGRMSEARDDSGRSVRYIYDSADRLSEVRYSDGEITRYEYDGVGRIVSVEDSSETLQLTDKYGAQGELTEQTLNGRTCRFRYATKQSQRGGHVTVTGPAGSSTNLEIWPTKTGFRYAIEKSGLVNQESTERSKEVPQR
jgi:YD repeat-containing protein